MAIVYSRVYKEIRLGRREQLIMLEIGSDSIDTASSFVDYMREAYGFSKSSVWYCLNRLKEYRLVGFANKEEVGKPLSLTRNGLAELRRLEPQRNMLVMQFSDSFMGNSDPYNQQNVYRNQYLRNGIYA